MGKVVLIVEPDAERRESLSRAFSRRDIPVYEVADAVDAMVAIGRAQFGAIVASEGKRQLSLRGLCHLARRRHPGLLTFVLGEPARQATVAERLGVPVTVLSMHLPAGEVVEEVLPDLMRARSTYDKGVATEILRPALPSDTATGSNSGPTLSLGFDGSEHGTERYELSGLSSGSRRQSALGEFTDEDTLLDTPGAVPVSVDLGLPVSEEAEETEIDVERPRFTTGDRDSGDDALHERTESAPVAPGPRLVSELHDTEPAPFAPVQSDDEPLFEGELSGGGGPALLMGIYAQEVTGRLEIDGGDCSGQVFFYAGEPVAARHPLGDAGLTSRLVAHGVMTNEMEAPAAPEGLLLSALVAEGRLRGNELHEFLREFVRDRVMALIDSREGEYRFVEDTSFLLTTPLLKVNPFGLIVESRRRRSAPASLLADSRNLLTHWVTPRPALGVVSERLRPFTRGVNLAQAVGARVRVGDLLMSNGLDSLHGTLLVQSLTDARLVELEKDRGRPARVVPAQVELNPAPTVKVTALPDSELSDDDLSADEQDVRDEIFTLYMRLKPLTRPAQVLGVELTATLDELRRAYSDRMRALDPARIPAGSAHALLNSRIDELRAKVTRAFEALKLQADLRTAKTRALTDTNDDDKNPW